MSQFQDTQVHPHAVSRRAPHAAATGARRPTVAAVEEAALESAVTGLFQGSVGRYLDVACGDGRITRVVARHCVQSLGVDPSDTALRRAREHCPGVAFHRADLTREDPDLGSFDLITAFDVLDGASDAGRREFLAVLTPRLRRDGFLIVNGHQGPWSVANLLGGPSRGGAGGSPGISPGSPLGWRRLRRLLRDHGLVPIRRVGLVNRYPRPTPKDLRARFLAIAWKPD